ncbi:MAG: hypothetical protein AAF411_13480, partial [Myxococcota bacterium]
FFADLGFTIGAGYATSGRRSDAEPDEVNNGPIGTGQNVGFVRAGDQDCPDEGISCVRLETPGLLPTYALRFTLGYWIIPRFAVAATVRFQFNAGEGSLSNLLLGIRAMYQVTQPAGEGLNANVFLGTSVGQIQLQPEQVGAIEPYIVSGLNGVQIGSNVGYRFSRNIGVTLTPEIHLLFPQFLFAIDLTASVSASF